MYSLMGSTEELDASLSRRERKKLETHHNIRRVALDVALEIGVESLTVEAITEAADVSQRTFFNYFSSKEDALISDASAAAEKLRPRILNRPAHESPLQALRMAITESDPLSFLHADRDRALARFRLVRDNDALMSRQLRQFSLLERSLAEAIAERLQLDPDSDLRPNLLAGVVSSVLRVAMSQWTADGQKPLSDVIGTAFDLLEQGLLTNSETGTT